ncbi:MAG: pilus assembly protein, partial [Actinomycetota bacterium]|nr:pilus assembly protein [Actinomycetota bacterium]
VQGQGVQVDAAEAAAAARAYLAQAGVEGNVSVAQGTTLVVETTMTYTPVFLGLIGVGPMSVQGGATVRLARGPNGG